jgi:hypothetical protein
MAHGRSGIRGAFGRAASFAAAALAVLTLVASGAVHEILHADEHGGPAAVAVAQMRPAAAQPVVSKTAPAKAAHHGAPIHGCSGHCAAHAAAQAPAPILAAMPHEGHAVWRLEASAPLSQLPTSGPERPPRA